ncbi:MAG: RNA-binding protein [Firmicutes bacterium]|nr:RNA-binding protein [Bacillota bacterium]
MEFSVGQIVRSTAGRDHGREYVVIAIEPKRVLVADGRVRTTAKPKAKNPLHLQLVSQRPAAKDVAPTDLEIRQILSEGGGTTPDKEEREGIFDG